MAINIVRIRPEDNVAVATRDIAEGESASSAEGVEVEALEEIPYGNKLALREIAAGEPIIKYAELIGHAQRDIRRGERVHTHNVETLEMPDVYVNTT